MDRDGAREKHMDQYQQKLHQSDARSVATWQHAGYPTLAIRAMYSILAATLACIAYAIGLFRF
jgi:hypothetical protein